MGLPGIVERRVLLEQRVQAAMAATPSDVAGNVYRALRWAKDRLTRLEGEGHYFQIVRERDGYVCAFAKPEWPGDHCSRAMPTGALAVVRAVHEYEQGM